VTNARVWTPCSFAQIQNDDVLYMVYRKEGSDEWEEVDLYDPDAPPKPEVAA